MASANLLNPEKILELLAELESSDSDKYAGITQSTRQYFFADPLMPLFTNGQPSIGNKLAFELFKSKNKHGFYISMDINDFRLVNAINHEEGDNAIRKIGYILRGATNGLKKSKLFRAGGDEFVFFTEIEAEIEIFITNVIDGLENGLAQLDLIDGRIKLSLSFGVGKSYLEADKALIIAKLDKKNKLNPIYNLI